MSNLQKDEEMLLPWLSEEQVERCKDGLKGRWQRMTLAEALREICDKQIPKEINGISTKYEVTEFEDCGIGAVKLSILPTNISTVDIGLTSNYLKRDYMTFTFDKGYQNNGYDLLEKDVKELLCWYIRNIMKWTDGKVVREITLEEWFKSEEGDSDA